MVWKIEICLKGIKKSGFRSMEVRIVSAVI